MKRFLAIFGAVLAGLIILLAKFADNTVIGAKISADATTAATKQAMKAADNFVEVLKRADAETAADAFSKADKFNTFALPLLNKKTPDAFVEFYASTDSQVDEYQFSNDAFYLVKSSVKSRIRISVNGAAIVDESEKKIDTDTRGSNKYTKISFLSNGDSLAIRYEIKSEHSIEPFRVAGKLIFLKGGPSDAKSGGSFKAQLSDDTVAILNAGLIDLAIPGFKRVLMDTFSKVHIEYATPTISPVVYLYENSKIVESRSSHEILILRAFGWR